MKAIHVNPSLTWGECSYTVRYSQKDGLTSMVPIYQVTSKQNKKNEFLIIILC